MVCSICSATQVIKHLLLDVNAIGYVYGSLVDITRRVKILK